MPSGLERETGGTRQGQGGTARLCLECRCLAKRNYHVHLHNLAYVVVIAVAVLELNEIIGCK